MKYFIREHIGGNSAVICGVYNNVECIDAVLSYVGVINNIPNWKVVGISEQSPITKHHDDVYFASIEDYAIHLSMENWCEDVDYIPDEFFKIWPANRV